MSQLLLDLTTYVYYFASRRHHKHKTIAPNEILQTYEEIN